MFDSIFRAAAAEIVNSSTGFGIPAVFTPKTGNPVCMDVVFRRDADQQPYGTAQTWRPGLTVEYALASLDREAAVGETFEIDGAVYSVRSIEANNGFTVKAVVT